VCEVWIVALAPVVLRQDFGQEELGALLLGIDEHLLGRSGLDDDTAVGFY
jgi:hypothetical protein